MYGTYVRGEPLEVRFWKKVDVRGEDDCWLWLAGQDGDGYGAFMSDKGPIRAHRFAWQSVNGPIPKGHTLHHRCETKLCCNPRHGRSMTRAAHGKLHDSPGSYWRNQTHCKRGHLRVYREKTGRACLICKSQGAAERYKRQKGTRGNHTA